MTKRKVFYPRPRISKPHWDTQEPILDFNIEYYQDYEHPPFKGDLGPLGNLPYELFYEVLSYLDIGSQLALADALTYPVFLAKAPPKIQALWEHAFNAIEGIAHIGLTHEIITVDKLYTALCSRLCFTCKKRAGYIYLLRCRRVCFRCFTTETRYLPLRFTHAELKFGIPREQVQKLPHFQSTVGNYALPYRYQHERTRLVDWRSAHELGVARHGSAVRMQNYVIAQKEVEIEANGGGYWLAAHRRVDKKEADPFRFMAIVRVPWLDTKNNMVVQGLDLNWQSEEPATRYWDPESWEQEPEKEEVKKSEEPGRKRRKTRDT